MFEKRHVDEAISHVTTISLDGLVMSMVEKSHAFEAFSGNILSALWLGIQMPESVILSCLLFFENE